MSTLSLSLYFRLLLTCLLLARLIPTQPKAAARGSANASFKELSEELDSKLQGNTNDPKKDD